MEKRREFSIDYMKAFAIFLVVLDHLITKSDDVENSIRVFIYSCHMPLFFFASGLLAAKKMQSISDIYKFTIKKCRLLAPVLVFGIGNVLILNQDIHEFVIWHKFGLWFLWTLLLFFIIYSFTQLLLVKNKNPLFEIFVLLIPVLFCIYARKFENTLWGGIFNCLNLYNYIFFVIGVLIKRYDKNKMVFNEKIQFVLFLVYILGMATGLPVLNIPMKICAVLFAYMVTTHFTEKIVMGEMNILQNAICKVGQSSLFIYVLHFYIISGVKHLPDAVHSVIYSSPCYYLLVYSIDAIFVIVSSVLISEVLKINKYIRYIAFGVK